MKPPVFTDGSRPHVVKMVGHDENGNEIYDIDGNYLLKWSGDRWYGKMYRSDWQPLAEGPPPQREPTLGARILDSWRLWPLALALLAAVLARDLVIALYVLLFGYFAMGVIALVVAMLGGILNEILILVGARKREFRPYQPSRDQYHDGKGMY